MAEIASRAQGVVTRRQLLRAGLSNRQIDERVKDGSLLRIYHGVYRVGHRAPSVEATYMAAVLAGGHGTLLCGAAAAYLLGILKGSPPEPEIVSPRRRRIAGLRTRQANRTHKTLWRGIPVTSPAQTLVDLAADLSEEDLARACHEAGVRHHTRPSQVKAILARRPNRPGAAKLRAVMSGDVNVALSKLERGFHHLIESNHLPPPRETNRPAGSKRVDCRWPQYRLTVELDSYRFHNSRHSWEQDRAREREARARGDDFRRYTWKDLFEYPERTLADLRTILPIRG
ncbi:MAG TPA: type IV toxin-antitoxin system AbiEi family antitoxin domain-containing protein [Solirubrobacterales bacterium]|nr:type IV toxin-antitoxin system AbiEi family antitoxin domain-containing protein [Solirubrobacterales bacterium]